MADIFDKVIMRAQSDFQRTQINILWNSNMAPLSGFVALCRAYVVCTATLVNIRGYILSIEGPSCLTMDEIILISVISRNDIRSKVKSPYSGKQNKVKWNHFSITPNILK